MKLKPEQWASKGKSPIKAVIVIEAVVTAGAADTGHGWGFGFEFGCELGCFPEFIYALLLAFIFTSSKSKSSCDPHEINLLAYWRERFLTFEDGKILPWEQASRFPLKRKRPLDVKNRVLVKLCLRYSCYDVTCSLQFPGFIRLKSVFASEAEAFRYLRAHVFVRTPILQSMDK